MGLIEQIGGQIDQTTGLTIGQRVVITLGHASLGCHQVHKLILAPEYITTGLLTILGKETHKGIRKIQPNNNESMLIADAGLLGLLCIFNLTQCGIPKMKIIINMPNGFGNTMIPFSILFSTSYSA